MEPHLTNSARGLLPEKQHLLFKSQKHGFEAPVSRKENYI
jgi:hypothetical protein